MLGDPRQNIGNIGGRIGHCLGFGSQASERLVDAHISVVASDHFGTLDRTLDADPVAPIGAITRTEFGR